MRRKLLYVNTVHPQLGGWWYDNVDPTIADRDVANGDALELTKRVCGCLAADNGVSVRRPEACRDEQHARLEWKAPSPVSPPPRGSISLVSGGELSLADTGKLSLS